MLYLLEYFWFGKCLSAETKFCFASKSELLSFAAQYSTSMKLLLSSILLFCISTNVLNAQEISRSDIDRISNFVLQIKGIKKVEGEVRIAMFNSKETYTKEPIHAVVLTVDSTAITWEVEQLPFGEYAIAIYHDKNTNGKLDTNILGIPKERYGFSNNARGRFGPASWADAMFVVDSIAYQTIVEIK